MPTVRSPTGSFEPNMPEGYYFKGQIEEIIASIPKIEEIEGE